MNKKITTTLFIATFILVAMPVLAHQPRLVESDATEVIDPEVSKAYYGELTGAPHIYSINAREPLDLYVGILMPYADDSEKDVQAEIRKNENLLQLIGGKSADWQEMFEFFGQSTYWDGGEYKANVDAGEYTITVSSTNNNSKYSLAIGEIEVFDGNETINALNLIPELKSNFFNESPISFIKSPFGWIYILIMYLLSFVFGFLYRFILKKFAKGSVRGVHKNIAKSDRLVRMVIAIGLLLWAITTSWSPWLLFFSGFALFEAMFSWCGFYAALGKNTCPV
ncbi:MAG: hypothetical protein ACI840_001286 [Ulvibacter sp.]|jgi:hypothetical protein